MKKYVFTVFALLVIAMLAVAQTQTPTTPESGTPQTQATPNDKAAQAPSTAPSSDMSADQSKMPQADTQAPAKNKKQAKAEKKEAKAAAKGKALRLSGWVKTEGDKTVFVNDKDQQTWTVQNADAVKAHDGQHVKVKATLDEANHSINVNSVKELSKRKQAGKAKATKS